jgi:hypothetical protein
MSSRNDVSVAPRRKGLHKATRNERSNIDALRVLVNGKGNQRQDLFLSEKDLKTFLSILSEHKVRYSFHLYVYALMKNHVHLLLEVGEIPCNPLVRGATGSGWIRVCRACSIVHKTPFSSNVSQGKELRKV